MNEYLKENINKVVTETSGILREVMTKTKGLIMKADGSYVMDSTEETAAENQDESQSDNKPPIAQVQLLLWDDIDDS